MRNAMGEVRERGGSALIYPIFFVKQTPFFSRFAGEGVEEKLRHQFRMNHIAQRARGDGAEGIAG